VTDEQHRRQLLTFNQEKVEQVYLQTKQNGIADPIVLVLDVQDDGARIMAGFVMGVERRDNFLEEARQREMTPVLVLGVEHAKAVDFFSRISADVEAALKKGLPPGYFWSIAVARGGRCYAGCMVPE